MVIEMIATACDWNRIFWDFRVFFGLGLVVGEELQNLKRGSDSMKGLPREMELKPRPALS